MHPVLLSGCNGTRKTLGSRVPAKTWRRKRYKLVSGKLNQSFQQIKPKPKGESWIFIKHGIDRFHIYVSQLYIHTKNHIIPFQITVLHSTLKRKHGKAIECVTLPGRFYPSRTISRIGIKWHCHVWRVSHWVPIGKLSNTAKFQEKQCTIVPLNPKIVREG